MVAPQTDDGGAAHLGDHLGRLLAAQHRVEQVDRDHVGEPRDRHLRQFLRGALHVQRRADLHPASYSSFSRSRATSARPASARSSVVSRSVTTVPAFP